MTGYPSLDPRGFSNWQLFDGEFRLLTAGDRSNPPRIPLKPGRHFLRLPGQGNGSFVGFQP